MILDDITASTRARVERLKAEGYYKKVHEAAEKLEPEKTFPFEAALRRKGLSFICEVKKASPSKGVISETFPYMDIAKAYEKAGADAISCLTEPEWFKGSIQYLREIAAAVKTPVLRKDFIIDSCQIEEAAAAGASAVLLIAAVLTDRELRDYRERAEALGLSALTEAHNEEELRRAAASGAKIIGVNNRNLKDFTIDLGAAERLYPLVPEGAVYVAESGMMTEAAVARMKDAGADAVLIGEMLMRAADPGELLERLRRDNQ